MTTKPGPAAQSAFRLGMVAAIVLGLAALSALFSNGTLTATTALYVLFALFPVYLVLVAAALSVWLGYDKDVTDLRPVYR
jgi:choline-glycine betaine transporter